MDSSLSVPSDDCHSNASAVLYKPAKNRHLQTSRLTVIHNADSSRLALEWLNKVHLSDKYYAYRDKLIPLLALIWLM